MNKGESNRRQGQRERQRPENVKSYRPEKKFKFYSKRDGKPLKGLSMGMKRSAFIF